MSETLWLDIQGYLLWSALELLLFGKRRQAQTQLTEATLRRPQASRPLPEPQQEEEDSLGLEKWDIHLLRHRPSSLSTKSFRFSSSQFLQSLFIRFSFQQVPVALFRFYQVFLPLLVQQDRLHHLPLRLLQTSPANPPPSGPFASPRTSSASPPPSSLGSSDTSATFVSSSPNTIEKDTTPSMPDSPGSPGQPQNVPIDNSPRARCLLSFVKLATSFIRDNGAVRIVDLELRLSVCHTRHLRTVHSVFVELASHLLDTGKVELSEAANLIAKYEEDPDWEVVIDSVKMVEDTMSGPLGFALLGIIFHASWGYTDGGWERGIAESGPDCEHGWSSSVCFVSRCPKPGRD
ncbi:hypothetical protein QBC36DRAFT_380276 [Triangularia setosa]|uniref:Uncharacterized protein n=1 Tax=Triangularia setosa TaxID=2587417 RepID=A0AAN7A3S0_9PEZI|nr:hypothetical protein QBC36DRAFT_380276 [Podospora setosa]